MEDNQELLAHMVYERNGDEVQIRTHSLYDHAWGVAELAAKQLSSIGLSSFGLLAGLLHDGKGTKAFQNYLKINTKWDAFNKKMIGEKPEEKPMTRGSVNHTFAGVCYILDNFHQQDPVSQVTSEIIAYAIGSHHGLFDIEQFYVGNGFEHRREFMNTNSEEYKEAIRAFEAIAAKDNKEGKEVIEELFARAKDEFQAHFNKISEKCRSYTMTRNASDKKFRFPFKGFLAEILMQVSAALIYADRKDTAMFFEPSQNSTEYKDVDWEAITASFEEKYSAFLPDASKMTPINVVRKKIADQCLEKASSNSKRFRMHCPTGAGKTLSSLRFALHHAKQQHKSAIIYVMPYLSIIHQNAEVIRSFLPNVEILEHHSDFMIDTDNGEEWHRYELEKNRWDAKVIITTTVKLLEILYAKDTTSLSRLHRLNNAVIIFDEIQLLPFNFIKTFNLAFDYLTEFANTSVVLCSATQPTLDRVKELPLWDSGEEIVTLSKEDMKVFDRNTVSYAKDNNEQMNLEELTAFADALSVKQSPLMIVCNKKQEALTIYQKLQEIHADDDTYVLMHLSASMCKTHQQQVLKDIQQLLKQIQNNETDKKLVLVTTQIVEAGVDVSFRSVVRIMAGVDNLIQCAGRCNRSNEYGTGNVYSVNLQPENLNHLKQIQTAKECFGYSISIFGKELKLQTLLNDQSFIQDYFLRTLTGGKPDYTVHIGNSEFALSHLLCDIINNVSFKHNYQLHLPLKTISQQVTVFDDSTYEIVVPYQGGKELIQKISNIDPNEKIPKDIMKEISSYSVKIYQWQKDLLEQNGMLELKSNRIWCLHENAYNEIYGLDNQGGWKDEDFIF